MLPASAQGARVVFAGERGFFLACFFYFTALWSIFRKIEELQLQLTKANERATELQEDTARTSRHTEEAQEETHKKHRAELQNVQEKLGSLVRTARWKSRLAEERKRKPLQGCESSAGVGEKTTGQQNHCPRSVST